MMSLANIAKGYINHIIDPSNFWIQIGYDIDFVLFQSYSEKLNSLYNERGHDFKIEENSLHEGDKVMVASSENHWNRAQVARINEDTLDVFYVDLGFTEIVNLSQVRFITQKMFDYIPGQVRRMGLAGIRPLSPSWTSRATAYFTNLVLHKNVLVAITDMDLNQNYGLVLIFVSSDDGSWISVTEKMILDEMGLHSSNWPLITSLSKEFVESLESMERQYSEIKHPSQGVTNQQQDLKETAGLCTSHNIVALTESPCEASIKRQELTSASHTTSQPTEVLCDFTNPVYIPPPGWENFKENGLIISGKNSSRSSSVKTVSETGSKKKKKKEIIEWGRTDLYVGISHVFSDFHEQISQQLQSQGQCLEETEYDLLSYKRSKVDNQSQSGGSVSQSKCDDKYGPLDEPTAYSLEIKIKTILRNKHQDEHCIVCALVHDIIEPGVHMSVDYLGVIITCILETLVDGSNFNIDLSLFVLDTYTVSELFVNVMIQVLRDLKSRYVKVPQSTKLQGHHLDFVQILSCIFNHSICWSLSMSKPIQNTVISFVEQWILFNKQRLQDYESSVKVEIMYLECVGNFLLMSSELLIPLYPNRYNFLIAEMKAKLLHDMTHRVAKQMLLNMVLILNKNRVPQRNVAVQTVDDTDLEHLPSGSFNMFNVSSSEPYKPPSARSKNKLPSPLRLSSSSKKVNKLCEPTNLNTDESDLASDIVNLSINDICQIGPTSSLTNSFDGKLFNNASDDNQLFPLEHGKCRDHVLRYSKVELRSLNTGSDKMGYIEPFEFIDNFKTQIDSEASENKVETSESQDCGEALKSQDDGEIIESHDNPVPVINDPGVAVEINKHVAQLNRTFKNNINIVPACTNYSPQERKRTSLGEIAIGLFNTGSLDCDDSIVETRYKKKTKTKYLSLQEYEERKNLTDDLNLTDQASAKPLKLYEQIRNEEKLRNHRGHMITAPRLGSASGSSSKRPSLFQKVSEVPQPPSRGLWVPPTKWNCSRCNGDHDVVDCTSKNFMENDNYKLLI